MHAESLPDSGGRDGDEYYVYCKQCGFPVNVKTRGYGDSGLSEYGSGRIQHSTLISVAVSAGDMTVNVDSTSGFDSAGTVTIYDHDRTGCRDEDFVYSSKTLTTFIGAAGAHYAHAVGVNVRDDIEAEDGCPFCGSMAFM